MLFTPISLLDRWLFCSVLQLGEPLELLECLSASTEVGFGTKMEHRWRVLGEEEEEFSEVSE